MTLFRFISPQLVILLFTPRLPHVIFIFWFQHMWIYAYDPGKCNLFYCCKPTYNGSLRGNVAQKSVFTLFGISKTCSLLPLVTFYCFSIPLTSCLNDHVVFVVLIIAYMYPILDFDMHIWTIGENCRFVVVVPSLICIRWGCGFVSFTSFKYEKQFSWYKQSHIYHRRNTLSSSSWYKQ